MGETWDLVASFEVDTLFQATISSPKLLFPLFNAISSSFSLEELFGRAFTKVGR